jgi:TerC family integral membrane protein
VVVVQPVHASGSRVGFFFIEQRNYQIVDATGASDDLRPTSKSSGSEELVLLVQSIGGVGAWLGFLALVAVMLAIDLGLFHRKAHVVTFREAAAWSAVWVALALAWNVGIWAIHGPERALEFATGYVIEKALSVDNIFVFVVIFSYFAVPAIYQHRVLFWGILGALAMRGLFIWLGAELLEHFHWAIYVFGGVLVLTGVKLALQKHDAADPSRNLAVRLFRRFVPLSSGYDGPRFFTRENGRRTATPLLLSLAVVEFTDLVFAVDSIPAIFAVTTDPFIVFTSNIFAILGLRSLYFLLADVVQRFRYLKAGLAAVLVFVGTKMAIAEFWKIPVGVSLLVVAATLGVAILASLRAPKIGAGATASDV